MKKELLRKITRSGNVSELADLAKKYLDIKNQPGSIGNGVLYALCKKYPRHDDDNAIESKVWLIGRAYAAAIERRKKNRDIGNDKFYHKIVVHSFKNSKLDEKIKAIESYAVITEKNIIEILEVHKYLVDRMEKITGLEKRSLASKYLHFHLPNLFFIYDSRAASVLMKKPSKLYKKVINSPRVDKAYASFFYSALKARNAIEKEIGEEITPRAFDCALIEVANKKKK